MIHFLCYLILSRSLIGTLNVDLDYSGCHKNRIQLNCLKAVTLVKTP